MEIENNGQNTTVFAYCVALINQGIKYSELPCRLNNTNTNFEYENIYLLPYNLILRANVPYEVIMNTTLKAENHAYQPVSFLVIVGHNI